MKRKERHHLKQNALAHTLESAREFVETHQRQVAGALVGAAVIGVAVIGFMVYRAQTQSRGSELLAEAMVALNARVVPTGITGEENLPAGATLGATGTFSTEEAKLKAALPKLKAAADAYPDSAAGITARYHMAGALSALERHQEAIKEFDEVVQRSGASSLYGRMSRLGKADAQAQSGQLDGAIATWKEMTTDGTGDLPLDAILIELARAYVQKGNTEEARKTLTLIVDEHPNSPYLSEARTELENLKS